ncbi:MAG: hypothetical protein RL154_30 [Pseudomonadota bacterium]|jgi:hypothetical protein
MLHPDAMRNLKLAEISMNREVRKVHLITFSSQKKLSENTVKLEGDSRRRFILDHLIVGDIIRTRKSAQAPQLKVIDVDSKAILTEKLAYNQSNELKSTGQRSSVEASDIVEIFLSGNFLAIDDPASVQLLTTRKKNS